MVNVETLKEQLKKASICYLRNEVREIMNSKNFGQQWEVGTDEEYYTVSWITEKGCNYMTCTCMNGSKHNLRNPECWHKQAVRMKVQMEVFK